jgi:hypothetical protein
MDASELIEQFEHHTGAERMNLSGEMLAANLVPGCISDAVTNRRLPLHHHMWQMRVRVSRLRQWALFC